MAYIGKTTDGFGVRNRFVYLASSGATSVSGADANGATLTFTDGAYVDVYLNGVLLKPTTDYNTSTANTVAGLSALNTNDEVTVVVYDIFTVADMVSATSGGTFVGNVTFNGDVSVGDDLSLASDGAILNFGADNDVRLQHVADTGLLLNDNLTITTADNDPQLTLTSTDADSGVGPRINLYRNSASPADDDALGFIYAQGENDADELTDYGFIGFFADDVTNGSEDGNAYVILKKDGTSRNRVNLTSTETVFNDDSVDLDFRVEGDTSDHAFFVRGDDSNIGIGTSTPDRMGSANSRGVVSIASNSYAVLELVNGDSDGDGNLSTINFVFDNNTAANNGQVVLLRGYTDGTQAGHRGGRFSVFTKNNNASGLNEHFRINRVGTITATDTDGFDSISDERLKTNIEDFTYSIDKFKKYKPIQFDWKNPEVHGERSNQWGFTAQAVEKIDGRFVHEYVVEDTEGIKDEDGNQIVHPDRQYLDADDIAKSSKLQQKDAMYISVIQQLIARIEALESK